MEIINELMTGGWHIVKKHVIYTCYLVGKSSTSNFGVPHFQTGHGVGEMIRDLVISALDMGMDRNL
jgi:hypothetical protein